MTEVLAVDPPGCGCTECLTGVYVPLDQATPSQVAAAARGVLGNNTGFGRAELAARSLPRVPDEVQEIHARIRAHDRDGNPVPDFRLRCPFCGGELDTFTPDYGSSPSENLLSGIDCGDCGAAWAPSGWLFRAPHRDPGAGR